MPSTADFLPVQPEHMWSAVSQRSPKRELLRSICLTPGAVHDPFRNSTCIYSGCYTKPHTRITLIVLLMVALSASILTQCGQSGSPVPQESRRQSRGSDLACASGRRDTENSRLAQSKPHKAVDSRHIVGQRNDNWGVAVKFFMVVVAAVSVVVVAVVATVAVVAAAVVVVVVVVVLVIVVVVEMGIAVVVVSVVAVVVVVVVVVLLLVIVVVVAILLVVVVVVEAVAAAVFVIGCTTAAAAAAAAAAASGGGCGGGGGGGGGGGFWGSWW